jgi:hypothetical protein
MLLGDRAQGGKHRNTGICENDVELAFLSIDLDEEAIEVAKAGHVSLHASHVLPDLLDRRRQLGLTPAPQDAADLPPRQVEDAQFLLNVAVMVREGGQYQLRLHSIEYWSLLRQDALDPMGDIGIGVGQVAAFARG